MELIDKFNIITAVAIGRFADPRDFFIFGHRSFELGFLAWHNESPRNEVVFLRVAHPHVIHEEPKFILIRDPLSVRKAHVSGLGFSGYDLGVALVVVGATPTKESLDSSLVIAGWLFSSLRTCS
eukprot:CAMPEP_0168319552 /NCGR_PEP_ID=MMETSP0213-20121227/1125_1 /TAXON_ID=151035 /ORGANISM="Euplotes harpa, Strain FSP1.4" /LENGTH=123 /DNA_ID=CAMNT_0008320797 /DNA_START=1119 /DNA_END=1487 /DNA_ORIENTATION=+